MERKLFGVVASALLATEALLHPQPYQANERSAQNETAVLGGMFASGNRLEARVVCLKEGDERGYYIESPQVVYINDQRYDYPRNLVEVVGNRNSGLSVIWTFMTDNTDTTMRRGPVGRISWVDQPEGQVTFIDPQQFQFNPGTQLVGIEGNLTDPNVRAGLTHSCYGPKSS